MSPVTSPRTRLAALCTAILLVFAAACASSSEAGDGFRLRAGQLTTSTTTTTAPVQGAQIATAIVPEVAVFAEKPTAFGVVPETTPSTASPGGTAPIPRDGLNSAGSRKTDTGWAYTNPTYWGQPLVMLVTQNDGEWLKVRISARPNGLEGWIQAKDVTLGASDYKLELTKSDFTLRAYKGEEKIVETQVVIGKDSTPTPIGEFYLGEILPAAVAGVSPGGAYGPYILPTNGYSEVLDLFDSGLPVVAFHGTNQPGLIGTQASNGCIRMPNEVVTQLAETIPPGTPITIKD